LETPHPPLRQRWFRTFRMRAYYGMMIKGLRIRSLIAATIETQPQTIRVSMRLIGNDQKEKEEKHRIFWMHLCTDFGT
jgi:hypothetical protein